MPAKPAKRRVQLDEFPTWHVAKDGWGRVCVVDAFGETRLIVQSDDPVTALEVGALAAAAPDLREGIDRLAKRLTRIDIDYGPQLMKRDEKNIEIAYQAIHASKPRGEDYEQAFEERQQVQIVMNESQSRTVRRS